MGRYRECPNCGNSEKGFLVLQCNKCGHLGCTKVGILTDSGCWIPFNCPSCDSPKHRTLGRIT
jgi:hypothetical protein